jgi:ubiquinone/menaquinone biosynthesis C-methylase UbiE
MKNTELLKNYYKKTAHSYDLLQVHDKDEHHVALLFLAGYLLNSDVSSILDVGTGTGRALVFLKKHFHDFEYKGIELVPELREIALSKGLSSDEIDLGSAENLPYENNQFNVVTAFGVLHHIENPSLVIQEMVRVSSKYIYISDHNIYGWGSPFTKIAKQSIRNVFGRSYSKYILTGFKGCHDTDYDGIFYPFSIFDYLPLLKKSCNIEFIISTKGAVNNLYNSASHIAVLASKYGE